MEAYDLIKLFREYGLTKNQSIILASLIQQKSCISVKEISEFSNLARETIYKILFDLKEIGLVQKAIARPKKYCAIPLENTLQFLYEQKKIQISELEMHTINVLENYTHESKNSPIEEKTQFILVPKKIQLEKRMEQSISNSKEIVRIFTSW